jgi:mono/diheme cytochrome c family protein
MVGVHRRFLLFRIVAGATVLLTHAQAQDSPESSFRNLIQPIIFKNCNGCHTFGGHAGGLRMDSYESLLRGGELGPVVVSGSPDASLIVKAVRYGETGLQMPPRGKIPDADIRTIEQWVASLGAGAPVASVPPVNPAPEKSIALPPVQPEIAPVAEKATPEQEQFFEAKIRPLLSKNCFTCHTREASGGLRLDSREALIKGGKNGMVVTPGDPESSRLIQALRYSSKIQMPPAGKLKEEEIASVEQWIRDGAVWPQAPVAASTKKVTAADRKFWSFHLPERPVVPAVASSWAYNDIDRFILAKLDEKHLKPVADASKRTLIRRISYDLTGLPPTPAAIQAFLEDKSANAYEKLVDQMLASQAYGERWGRKWLDVVRYADTSGGGGDYPIPQAYKYRDYVIQSFAKDKPYDRFIREQIAGDLLPAETEEERWQNLVATGYLAGTNRYEGKAAYVSDAVDNLGSAFLGVTLSCARCHDHKFDPIPAADYYAIYGILSSTHFPESGNDAIRFQREFVFRDPKATERPEWKIFQTQLKPIQDAIEAVLKLPGTYDDLIPQLQARRMHLFEHLPDIGESAYAVTEGKPEDAQIQRYGDPKDLAEQVRRGFVQVLGGSSLPADVKGSGRLELANWIASKDNPLTARVMVNRIWQGHFGRGIVSTANDFGTRGAAPSNQPLLDYLAAKFIESGWSVRAIHKEILQSHAYRLSSAGSPRNEEIDPENAYIWQHSRVRLDAEQIRDSLLATSQLLDRTQGAAHPFPPQSEWNWEDQNHFSPVMAKYETNRRTVYMMIQRTVRLPYFTLFDGPNTNVSTEQRGSSLTPLQALYFMNGDFPKKCATALTGHLFANSPSEKANVEQTFLLVYGRPPGAPEMERTAGFLRAATDSYITHGASSADSRQKAFEDFVKALFASNEFMFVE